MKIVKFSKGKHRLTSCAITHPDDFDAEKDRLVYKLLIILQHTNILLIEFNKAQSLHQSKSGKVINNIYICAFTLTSSL